MSDCRGHHGDREAVRKRDGHERQASVDVLRLRAVDSGKKHLRERDNRACADEDQRERTDELGEAASQRVVIHPRGKYGRSRTELVLGGPARAARGLAGMGCAETFVERREARKHAAESCQLENLLHLCVLVWWQYERETEPRTL